ncbi:hypothetical protein Tco_0920610 [Tanacetum coccineum]
MQAARDRQKSYADLKRKPMEFQVEDKVMLKVLPWKGVVHFGKQGKLNPRYVGPFKVLEKVGEVAYKLELPEELSRVHNTFYVSNLKKCHADEPLAVPLDGLHLDDKLHFVEEPLEIVGREVKRLKRSWIPLVKVRWNSKRGPEFTWEREDQFKKKYPNLFTKTTPSSSAASDYLDFVASWKSQCLPHLSQSQKTNELLARSHKSLLPSPHANTGGGVPTSGYNPLLGTFHALKTEDHLGNSVGMGVEYDSVSNNGSWSGESEDHKEKNTQGSSHQETTTPGADNDKCEKIRQKNEKKHQRQKERRAQELHERCSGGEDENNQCEPNNLDGGGNLKIDISEELAQITEMEMKFKCSKQEVERAIIACEGDLEQAAETLKNQKQEQPPAAPPKLEENGDPLTIANEKRWPVGGSNSSVSYSLTSPLQAAPPPAKIDLRFANIGTELKNL